jgi:hypothetical protein
MDRAGATNPINVRVGNHDDIYGLRRGFDSNPLCAFVMSILPTIPTTIYCKFPMEGRYISIQAVSTNDRSAMTQLQLCEIGIVQA